MVLSRTIAFAGDPAVKLVFETRLAKHIADGDLMFDGDVWDGERGRPTGCIAHSADIKVYEAETGFPASLGLLLDFLHMKFQGDGSQEARSAAHRFVSDWIADTPVGVDLGGAPSRVVAMALSEAMGIDPNLAARHLDIATACDGVLTLHRRVIDGDMPERGEWTAVRAAAVRATDKTSDKLTKLFATCVEAVAWSPANSRSFLVDLAAPLALLHLNRTVAQSGWTDLDEAAANKVLETLWLEQAAVREAGGSVDFKALFAARDPILSKRYADHFDVGNAAYPEAMWALAKICRHVIMTSPTTAAS